MGSPDWGEPLELKSIEHIETIIESEMKYRTIVENSLSGAYIVQDHLFRFVNTRWCRMFGYSLDEVVDKLGPRDITHPDDRPVLETIIKKFDADESASGKDIFTHRAFRKDGTIITVLVLVSPIVYKGRTASSGTVLDVTEYEKAREELRQKTALLEAQVNASLDGIIIANKGKIILQNQQANDYFVVPACITEHEDDTVQVEWIRNLAKDPEEIHGRIARTLTHPDEMFRGEIELKDGKVLDVYSSPVIGENGTRYGRIWTLRDITDLKRSEQALRAGQIRLSAAMDLAHIVYWESELGVGILNFNDPFYAFYGTTAEQEGGYQMGMDDYIQRFVHPDDRPFFYRRLEENSRITDPDAIPDMEHRIVRRDGEVRHILVRTRGISDHTGSIARVQGAIQDITEIKRAEAALKKSEEKYRSIFENCTEGIFQSRPDGLLTAVNPSLARMHGYDSPEQMIDEITRIEQVYVSPEAQKILYREVEQAGFLDNVQAELYRRDRSIFRASLNVRTVRNAEGATLYYEGTVEDVTDRKRMEDTFIFLVQRPWTTSGEGFFYALARHISVTLGVEYTFIGRLKEDGNCVETIALHGNGKIEPNIEYTLAGTPCENVVGKCLCLFSSGIRSLFPDDTLLHEMNAEGYAGIPLWDSQGLPIGIIAIVSCSPLANEQLVASILQLVAVSAAGELERNRAEQERERLEAQLRQAQKMEAIGNLAGGIAHDFNNLLTVQIGFGSLLKDSMSEDDPRRAYVEQMLISSEKAAELTRSMLSFSRKQHVELHPQSVNCLIDSSVQFLKRILSEDIELKVGYAVEDLTILADETQITRIFMNLASNAKDAMPMGGVLSIRVERKTLDAVFAKTHGYGAPGTYALIIVADTGMGMDERTKEHVFEPFFTTKGVGKGTGLGLSSVYGIVKQHAGYITVYSEPGYGTTFRIYLPLAEVVEERRTTAPKDIRGGTETILVAEDDLNVRGLVTAILKRFGYSTLEAGDGEEALRMFVENRDAIDLVITDVVMPKKNGRELYEELKKIDPHIKIIFSSGYTADAVLDKGILEGTVEFIPKPLVPGDLLTRVRQVLDKQG